LFDEKFPKKWIKRTQIFGCGEEQFLKKRERYPKNQNNQMMMGCFFLNF
jgi:hypothetical protein